MSIYLYDMAGRAIAFRRSWDDAYVFDLSGRWIGWCPWADTEVVDRDGDPLGSIVGDRLVVRNDCCSRHCDQHAEDPGPVEPTGTPAAPLHFHHRFAYSDLALDLPHQDTDRAQAS